MALSMRLFQPDLAGQDEYGRPGEWRGARLQVGQLSTKIRSPDREPRHAVLSRHDPVVQPHPQPPRRTHPRPPQAAPIPMATPRTRPPSPARAGSSTQRRHLHPAGRRLIPIDRAADQKPYESGKHQRHGVNVQVIADALGRLVWASAALPGATHDLTAACAHGIIDAPPSRPGRSSPSCVCCPRRVTAIVEAILVLHRTEAGFAA
jgi:hypothetical protein